ncbi:hypothetical protein ACIQU6_21390 [Streptomyces sp. NPDC090442]|uniref:hypothetical protein n=1 Tax=Streptomyces sp. NPDC090442 TaxID=3365962 RepID=UPI0038075B31
MKWEVRPGLIVSYTEKTAIGTSFVMAASSLGAAEVEGSVAVFVAHPLVMKFDDLLASHDGSGNPAEQGSALARLGLGAPIEPDDRFVSRLQAGAFAEHGAVREGALWGMAYAEWSVFREPLRQASLTDSDDFLKKVASTALQAFDRIGVPES